MPHRTSGLIQRWGREPPPKPFKTLLDGALPPPNPAAQ